MISSIWAVCGSSGCAFAFRSRFKKPWRAQHVSRQLDYSMQAKSPLNFWLCFFSRSLSIARSRSNSALIAGPSNDEVRREVQSNDSGTHLVGPLRANPRGSCPLSQSIPFHPKPFPYGKELYCLRYSLQEPMKHFNIYWVISPHGITTDLVGTIYGAFPIRFLDLTRSHVRIHFLEYFIRLK